MVIIEREYKRILDNMGRVYCLITYDVIQWSNAKTFLYIWQDTLIHSEGSDWFAF